MGINYKKILSKERKFKVDKKLLKEIEYNEILFIISKEIVGYREENGLKQSELAQKLDMSQVMISKMESGKYNYTIKSLVNLWNTLATDTNNFGANLLKKIYDKVVKNYYNTVEAEIYNDSKNIEYKFASKDNKVIYNKKLYWGNSMNENYIDENYIDEKAS